MKSTLTLLITLISFSGFTQVFVPGEPISVSDTLGNYFPQIEITGDGVPGVIWTDQYELDIYFAKHNGVDDFMTPVKLNPDGTDVQAFNWSGANIAVEGDNIYVVFHSDGFSTGHVYFVKSTDNGATWSDTVRVDNLADGHAQFPDITVKNDTLWVVLLDHDASGLNPHYRVTRSVDGGATWEPDVQASELWAGESCDCCSPEIVSDDDYVIVLSRNNDNNIREFKGVVSYDRGATFTGMIDIDMHAWNIMSCPSVGASAQMTGVDELMAIYRTEYMSDPHIYLHHYDLDGDSTFTEVDILADASTNNNLVNYPQMDYTTSDNRIGIVWESFGNGIDVFFNATTSGPDALLSSQAINLTDTTGTQNKPDIVIENGNYHVVYMDTDGFDVKYLQVFESAAGIEESKEFPVLVYPNPTSDKVTFEFDNTNNELISIIILDLQGRIVKSLETIESSITINPDLEAGAYIYQIKSAKGILVVE